MDNVKLNEICKANKITDYLLARGFEPANRTGKIKYKCPLPSHPGDNTPSFFVSEKDGIQLFKCFGCGAFGNIITITRLMEGGKNGHIINKLARVSGIELGGFVDIANNIKIEPAAHDVMNRFCEQDEEAILMAERVKSFISANDCSEDIINKISKVYEQLDYMIEVGDSEGLKRILEILDQTIMNYEG